MIESLTLMGEIPERFAALLRDPNVYLSVERDAIRSVRAWVLGSAEGSEVDGHPLIMDRYMWSATEEATAGPTRTPSAA